MIEQTKYNGLLEQMSEKSYINGRELVVSNDHFRSLHALRSECNSYTQAELRYNELIAEHDSKVRADAIEELADYIKKHFRIGLNTIDDVVKEFKNTEVKKLRKECKYCNYSDKPNCPLL